MRKLLLSLLMFGSSAFYVAYQSVFAAPATAPTKKTTTPVATTPTASKKTTASTSNPPSTTPTQTVPAQPKSQYKNGVYTGSIADAYYGYVQVKATISGGQITDVTFLQYPTSHSTSVYINQQAMPYLKQEAIQAQSANVSGVTGATDTSQAFIQSLGSALAQARNA